MAHPTLTLLLPCCSGWPTPWSECIETGLTCPAVDNLGRFAAYSPILWLMGSAPGRLLAIACLTFAVHHSASLFRTALCCIATSPANSLCLHLLALPPRIITFPHGLAHPHCLRLQVLHLLRLLLGNWLSKAGQPETGTVQHCFCQRDGLWLQQLASCAAPCLLSANAAAAAYLSSVHLPFPHMLQAPMRRRCWRHEAQHQERQLSRAALCSAGAPASPGAPGSSTLPRLMALPTILDAQLTRCNTPVTNRATAAHVALFEPPFRDPKSRSVP